ncbi:lysylphosphatidylglycerol synthase domain-containing protein [Pusillimonas sp. SM2304]|uniref:lysylphosphatidylglycerol synthase domain-containing protein n=1 Tax=Pusillimonas sp. SM2304 TaxID=3073241 RepID=UPI002875E426|nr:lysylphosphatidylglycerol synthase domain-containing protein [Pusillimonas sp. SM2304]MDS1141475.1 lysylphosphatidylglycerol synthase domain-containing protein [Pusillimonas sp. SM2304]
MTARQKPRFSEWVKARWSLIRKIIVSVFVALVVVLIGVAVTHVEWSEVLAAIRQLPAMALAIAALITLASYLLYSCFDLLGKRYTHHGLAWWRSMMVGFISYAFTMNMGAPVGGIGLRMRLYTKQGLAPGVVLRVMGFSIATNWMGYVLLAGTVFALGKMPLPADWELGNGALRLIGAAMVLAVVAYVLLCAFSRTRSWTVRGHDIKLPSLRLALLQLTVSMLNWALMGAVVYVLLQQKVDYPLVLGTLLISAVAGVITHIPGGLGVLEGVFVALLASSSLPRFEILGAILVYRAVYYLAPLLLAGAWYLAAEAKISGAKTA